MSTTMVTIAGTWSRTNTSREEVYDYRRVLRTRFRNLGGNVDFVLPQNQKDLGEYPTNAGTKSGTFRASVPLRYNHHGWKKNTKVAKLVVEAILAGAFCRAPKLKVDPGRTQMRTTYAESGLL